jgi:hypothetical protein
MYFFVNQGKPNHKIGEFSTQDAIISSTTYKELNRKFVQLKREQAEEREKVLNVTTGIT